MTNSQTLPTTKKSVNTTHSYKHLERLLASQPPHHRHTCLRGAIHDHPIKDLEKQKILKNEIETLMK
jgi:hypothetical protein